MEVRQWWRVSRRLLVAAAGLKELLLTLHVLLQLAAHAVHLLVVLRLLSVEQLLAIRSVFLGNLLIVGLLVRTEFELVLQRL